MQTTRSFTSILATGLFLVCILISCKEEEVEFSNNVCLTNPPFVTQLGFNARFSFFSTSEEKVMGLVLHQSGEVRGANGGIVKSYQHPSWRQAGWLAPIQLDKAGNIYTAPAPFIHVLNNPVKAQNTIWKVDAVTGVMEKFMELPLPDSIGNQNPFGIIGMVLLCETNTLFVSTISGSDRQHERGAIYAIDLDKKKIIDQLTATDAMGMGISYITGLRKLYFGTGRSSDIYAIEINSKGKFTGEPEKELTIAGLGPAGDDKVRRIRTDNLGNLTIHGMEFNYNLIPQREKKETIYKFAFDASANSWIYQ